MTPYEYLCHACKRSFSKELTSAEYEEAVVACPYCGSEEVEQILLNFDLIKETA